MTDFSQTIDALLQGLDVPWDCSVTLFSDYVGIVWINSYFWLLGQSVDLYEDLATAEKFMER